MNLSLAGLTVFGTEGGAAASNPSHQGAAQRKLSSNIDSAAESDVGRRERGARLICRTPNLWGGERERGGRRGREGRKGGERARKGNISLLRFDVAQLWSDLASCWL